MVWTQDTPTVPGWYWHRSPSGVIWVEELALRGGQLVVVDQNGRAHALETCSGEWAGPIPQPEEA